VTYEEKGTWVYLVVVVATFGAYVAVLLSRADGGPLADVAYVAPLLWTIGISIVVSVVGRVVVEIARPSDSLAADARDKDIDRHGEYVGFHVLSVGVVGALVLTLVEAEHFWIANAIFLAFVLNAVTSSVVKLVAYRRGL